MAPRVAVSSDDPRTRRTPATFLTKERSTFSGLSWSDAEWVSYGQAVDLLSMLQIFGPQCRTVSADCSGDDQGVIDRELISFDEYQRELMGFEVECDDFTHLAHRGEDFPHLPNFHPQLANRNCGKFVKHLNAYCTASLKQFFGTIRLWQIS